MMREKSQSTQRNKFSLRNLLNIEPESLYKTNQLQIRPKTMYTQRQLKIFQDERNKIMTEHKLRRNNSQQLSRERQGSAELNSQDRAERSRLKHSLGKLNLLAEGCIQIQEDEKIKTIHRFLDSLSKTQNFYKKTFGYICDSFDSIVFTTEAAFPRQQLQFLTIETKNQALMRLSSGVKGITYKELTYELFQQILQHINQQQNNRVDTSQRFRGTHSLKQDIQNKLQEKSKIIAKLTQQIHFYEHHPSKEQYGYITELETKLHVSEMEVTRLVARSKQQESTEEYFKQYNNMLTERVEDMRSKLYEFEIEQFSGLKEVEGNSQLKDFQNNVAVLKDLLHKGAIRMSAMREQYNKIQTYNHQLLGQKSVLAKRAAVGFAQLTPRPNFKKIFKDNNMDYDQMLPQDKPSTEELVTALVGRFKQFYQKYAGGELKLDVSQSRMLDRKRKDPAQSILADLDIISKQMRRTQNLSENVKSGFIRQKEQKDELNRKNKKV